MKLAKHIFSVAPVLILIISCVENVGPPVGTKGVLISSAPWSPVAISEEVFSEWRKAKAVKDDHGQTLLIASKKILAVKSGTPVLVIDSGMAIRKVRILEGIYKGSSVWVYGEHIK